MKRGVGAGYEMSGRVERLIPLFMRNVIGKPNARAADNDLHPSAVASVMLIIVDFDSGFSHAFVPVFGAPVEAVGPIAPVRQVQNLPPSSGGERLDRGGGTSHSPVMDIPTHEHLLAALEGYRTRHKLSEWQVGKRAVNDGKLFRRLRAANGIGLKTARRIQVFLDAENAKPDNPAA